MIMKFNNNRENKIKISKLLEIKNCNKADETLRTSNRILIATSVLTG